MKERILNIYNLKERFINKKCCNNIGYTPNGISIYLDESEFCLSEMLARYVVYYTYINGKFYVGCTNCLTRRINEHFSRQDSNLYQYVENLKAIYIKPLGVYNTSEESRKIEKSYINAFKLMIPRKELINKI